MKERKQNALMGLLADIRAAVGDPTGKLMQDELVERCRRLHSLSNAVKSAEPLLRYYENQLASSLSCDSRSADRELRRLMSALLAELKKVGDGFGGTPKPAGGTPTLPGRARD